MVTTKPKTDYWRKTFLPVTGNFSLESRVVGKHAALYDQVGLMARIDTSNWLKSGLELVDGIGHASVVVTRDYSDWATLRSVAAKNHCGGASSAKALRSKFFILSMARTSSPLASAISHSKPPWMPALSAALREGTGFEASFDELRLTQ